jgi:putative ABC transport system substrate-binding protein
MRRRDLMLILGGTVVGQLRVARAEQKAARVIGWLSGGLPGPNAPFAAAFRQGLSDTGYVEGQNLAIEYRWAEGRYDQLPALAADLVGHKVDLIAAVGGDPTISAATNAAPTTPIVFFTGGDPVGAGYVASFARPGGNITGVSVQIGELTAKRLELVSELVPQARMIALLMNPTQGRENSLWMPGIQQAGRAKGMQLSILQASTEAEIDAALASLASLHADALVVGGDAFFNSRAEQIAKLASRYAVPAIFPTHAYIAAGGLISYGASFAVALRQVGVYAGKILKGAKPADLPVEQPTKFELVVNLKTAKALGLTVPQSILARADDVIE